MKIFLGSVILLMSSFLSPASHAGNPATGRLPGALLFRADTLPAGCTLQESEPGEILPLNIPSNPYLSGDREFIESFTRTIFHAESDIAAADIVEALYSIYRCPEKELGIFAWRFTEPELTHRGMMALSTGIGSNYRLSGSGSILVLLWHDGVDSETGLAMQRLVDRVLSRTGGPQMRAMSMDVPQE